MKNNCLIEIGCEELPANIVGLLSAQIKTLMLASFQKRELCFSDIIPYATPRRLAFFITNLDASTPSKEITRKGPYTNNTKAASGFAASCGLNLSEMKTITDSKGERLYYRFQQPGLDVVEHLITWLEQDVISKLQGIKTMRWGKPGNFVRPVQWLVGLYGQNILQGSIMHLTAGNISQGHRFMGAKNCDIKSPDCYLDLMRQNYVEPCAKQRLKSITQQIEKALPEDHCANLNQSLLEEIVQLVEWPVVLLGTFSSKYLKLPAEVLTAVLHKHQKCLTVDNNGLSNKYIIVSNIVSKEPEQVIKGNNHVIEARLSDAWFFYELDCKKTLSEHAINLSGMTYQAKLGTMSDKVLRLKSHADVLATYLGVNAFVLKQAASLCKADLACELVNELPEIQGQLARHFALREGIDIEIADALASHRQQSPKDKLGQALAFIDQLDHLLGFFSIGLQPSGDKDPFALRRAASAILHCIVANDLEIDLDLCLSKMNCSEAVAAEVKNFIFERLGFWCKKQGIGLNYLAAVKHLKSKASIKRITKILQLDLEPLVACYKRLSNITKSINLPYSSSLELVAPEELELYKHAQAFKYSSPSSELEQLKAIAPLVDNMLDNIHINVEQEKLKQHRQMLLLLVKSLFARLADFTKI